MSSSVETAPTTRTDRLLGGVERIGNKIPDPFVLFVGLFLVLSIVSTVMAALGTTVRIPGSEEVQDVRGLFTVEGIRWLTTNLVDNFVSFPPLGTVVVILLAVGLAQRSGLMSALIKVAFAGAPTWALPYAVAAVCMVGHVMADSVMIVIPPLAAMVFKAAGRHPVAGLLGAFAAAGAAYSTSFVVTSLDALFSGITQSVTASLPDAGTPVTPVSNWFYNIACSVVLTVVCGLLITKVLEPRLTRQGVPTTQQEGSEGIGTVEDVSDLSVSRDDRRGLRRAGVAAMLTVAVLVALTVVPGSPMRNESGGYLPESPLLDSVASSCSPCSPCRRWPSAGPREPCATSSTSRRPWARPCATWPRSSSWPSCWVSSSRCSPGPGSGRGWPSRVPVASTPWTSTVSRRSSRSSSWPRC